MIDLKIEYKEGFYDNQYKFTDMATESAYNYGEQVDFVVHTEPNGNCQTFSISYADEWKVYDIEEIKEILKAICKKVLKSQMLLDIKEEDSSKVLKVLKPFSKKQQIKRYISTNRNKMMLVIVVLDRNKIFK